MSSIIGKKNYLAVCVGLGLTLINHTVLATDSEVYLIKGATPRVMITVDTSGSMGNTPSSGGSDSKMQIAKDVITDVINSNQDIDFGIAVYNYNTNTTNDGGRIVAKVAEHTPAYNTTLENIINSLVAKGATPLCETMLEVKRYFKGQNVKYGLENPEPLSPARDTSAEYGSSPIKYKSPYYHSDYNNDPDVCRPTHAIVMTDGVPTSDIGNSYCINTAADMYNNDLNGTGKKEYVTTHTIGFDTSQTLLENTASAGNGKYYTADNATKLKQAFNEILDNVGETTSFTAPISGFKSYPAESSMDYVYYALFKPGTRSAWPGNIKKFKIENGLIKDVNGLPVFDSSGIKSSAQSYWSSSVDGNEIKKGGVGEKLVAAGHSSRKIKVDTGSLSAPVLTDFKPNVVSSSDPATSSSKVSFAEFGSTITAVADAKDLVKWARGQDIDDQDGDGDTTDTREWIMGDAIHSNPTVINYGELSGYSASNPAVRILVGTNQGFLHMFKGENGAESWAFIPRELLKNLDTLKQNNVGAEHPIGVDGTLSIHFGDHYWETGNKRGTVDGSDKVYAFFGLRRGGSTYYALDITDPDNPAIAWKINTNSSGFSELGQTWSTPQITKIELDNSTRDVVIFAGGYDTNKDAKTAGVSQVVGTDDSKGRAIYIVDMETGDLLWSATPDSDSTINKQVLAFADSIPAEITLHDTNNDNRTDRLYVGDTGGNIWRIDLYSDDRTEWTVHQVAKIGSDTILANDRQIFSRIDLVRTVNAGVPFEALLVGTGNRAHPLDTEVQNRFYMFKDKNIYSRKFKNTCGGSETNCIAPPAVITDADLYDATDNKVQDGSSSVQTTEYNQLLNAKGWYVNLGKHDGTIGEKSLGGAFSLQGVVYFTTYVPGVDTNDPCTVDMGRAYLWGMNIHYASAEQEWDGSSAGNSTAPEGVNKDFTENDRRQEGNVGGGLSERLATHYSEESVSILGGLNNPAKLDNKLVTEESYWYKKEH